jgi:hypothetical protein
LLGNRRSGASEQAQRASESSDERFPTVVWRQSDGDRGDGRARWRGQRARTPTLQRPPVSGDPRQNE